MNICSVQVAWARLLSRVLDLLCLCAVPDRALSVEARAQQI
jgi:hypothetical protein